MVAEIKHKGFGVDQFIANQLQSETKDREVRGLFARSRTWR